MTTEIFTYPYKHCDIPPSRRKPGSIATEPPSWRKLSSIATERQPYLCLNKDTNPHNAQLIFATHDTNILSYSKLRRDQIYFTQKNNWESTEIYSLSDFVYAGSNDPSKLEKERPDTDKEKRYLEGRYSAIPVLTGINNIKPLLQWQGRVG